MASSPAVLSCPPQRRTSAFFLCLQRLRLHTRPRPSAAAARRVLQTQPAVTPRGRRTPARAPLGGRRGGGGGARAGAGGSRAVDGAGGDVVVRGGGGGGFDGCNSGACPPACDGQHGDEDKGEARHGYCERDRRVTFEQRTAAGGGGARRTARRRAPAVAAAHATVAPAVRHHNHTFRAAAR